MRFVFCKELFRCYFNKKYNISIKYEYPRIIFIIPCFNCIKYIKSSLRSVQNQNMEDIEIIIANDYLNDETVYFLNELKKEDPRIEVYNISKNMNLFYTRSTAVLKARGKYIITIDADDMFVDSNVFDTEYLAAEDGNFDIISFRIFMVKYFSDVNQIIEHEYNYKEHNLLIYQPELSCYAFSTNGQLKPNDRNIWGKYIDQLYLNQTLIF